MAERVFPARTFDIGGGRIVPSPNQFYLTGEDNLRVVSVNSLAGVRVVVACRTANPQGDTVGHELLHVPATDRSTRREDFNIGQGSLLNVTAYASGGNPRVSQTHIMVQIVRGFGAAAVVLGTILGGSVTRVQALGFPGSPIQLSTDGPGFIRNVSGTIPAAGAEVLETVPTGARWELMSFIVGLVPSATVANRVPRLFAVSSGIVMFNVGSGVAEIASTLGVVAWMSGVGVYTPKVGIHSGAPLPVSYPLLAGATVQTLTLGLQVDDAYAFVNYTVREWLEVD